MIQDMTKRQRWRKIEREEGGGSRQEVPISPSLWFEEEPLFRTLNGDNESELQAGRVCVASTAKNNLVAARC